MDWVGLVQSLRKVFCTLDEVRSGAYPNNKDTVTHKKDRGVCPVAATYLTGGYDSEAVPRGGVQPVTQGDNFFRSG